MFFFFFLGGGGVQVNINRYKSSRTITPILIHILKTAAMLTTGDLAQMVGALMNDVTMELKQGFDSYCCFVFVCLFSFVLFLFCFVFFVLVCFLFLFLFCFVLFLFCFVLFCFVLFVCFFFFWRFPCRYRSLYRDRFFNLNHGLIICFSFLLLMDRLRIVQFAIKYYRHSIHSIVKLYSK